MLLCARISFSQALTSSLTVIFLTVPHPETTINALNVIILIIVIKLVNNGYLASKTGTMPLNVQPYLLHHVVHDAMFN